MRIGIDGGCLANRRGFGRFARADRSRRWPRLETGHEFVVFVDRPSLGVGEVPDGSRRVAVEVERGAEPGGVGSGAEVGAATCSPWAGRGADGLDLIYFPASLQLLPGLERRAGRRHDARHARPGPSRAGLPHLAGPARVDDRRSTPRSRWADRIVTVSEAARRDLMAWFRLPEERGPGRHRGPRRRVPARGARARVGRRAGAIRESIPGVRYCLYVGGLSPHKNLPRLIEAFARLRPADVRLVLVGDLGDVFHTHVPELARRSSNGSGWAIGCSFTGFVPDDDLALPLQPRLCPGAAVA